jgi:hypothetical protein
MREQNDLFFEDLMMQIPSREVKYIPRSINTAIGNFTEYGTIYEAVASLWYNRISVPNSPTEYSPFECRKIAVLFDLGYKYNIFDQRFF